MAPARWLGQPRGLPVRFRFTQMVTEDTSHGGASQGVTMAELARYSAKHRTR